MIKFTNKINGTINNIVGICRNYNISEFYIKNIKSHNFDNNFICINCNTNLDEIRSQIKNIIEFNKIMFEKEILSCNEMVIKKLLE